MSAARLRDERRRLEVERLGDHTDRLFRAALVFTGSYEDAQDLVQETFARVLRRPRYLTSDSDLRYLMQVMRNTWMRTSKRERQGATVELSEHHEATLEDASVATPADAVEGRELLAAVRALPEPYRQTVVAVDIVGLTCKEAARALGTREGTVMSRLFRARQKLADVVERSDD